MPRKPTPPPDDPEQSRRFVEAARAAGTDENPKAFERVFERVVLAKRSRPAAAAARKKAGSGDRSGS